MMIKRSPETVTMMLDDDPFDNDPFFVDVHTHLTHEDFADDWLAVLANAEKVGVKAVVVNGLEPKSNRQIVDWSLSHKSILPALGIYPLDSINSQLPVNFPFRVPVFDVNEEIKFIRSLAKLGKLAAIGECGLDAYYLDESYLPAQELVFEQMIDIGMTYKLPLIIHTRKAEKRAGEILAALGAKLVNFHCFGGRTALAKQYAEQYGWWFSIPANCAVNEAFRKMLKTLPPERLLTETDAPYLPPQKGTRNEPANVVGTVHMLAALRGWEREKAKEQVWTNFKELFASWYRVADRNQSNPLID